MSCCSHCMGADEIFNKKKASRDLKRYRKKGPDKSTRLLIDALMKENPKGKTLLDIGGGVGLISFELFEAGLSKSTNVDASAGYLSACTEEASKRGLKDHMKFVFGDFTELAGDLYPADIVTLDRVVCCYPDMKKLVESSAGKAVILIGLVYPRIHAFTKVAISLGNLWFRIRSVGFRTYLHPPQEIDHMIQKNGFSRIFFSQTLIWEVAVYRKQGNTVSIKQNYN